MGVQIKSKTKTFLNLSHWENAGFGHIIMIDFVSFFFLNMRTHFALANSNQRNNSYISLDSIAVRVNEFRFNWSKLIKVSPPRARKISTHACIISCNHLMFVSFEYTKKKQKIFAIIIQFRHLNNVCFNSFLFCFCIYVILYKLQCGIGIS